MLYPAELALVLRLLLHWEGVDLERIALSSSLLHNLFEQCHKKVTLQSPLVNLDTDCQAQSAMQDHRAASFCFDTEDTAQKTTLAQQKATMECALRWQ